MNIGPKTDLMQKTPRPVHKHRGLAALSIMRQVISGRAIALCFSRARGWKTGLVQKLILGLKNCMLVSPENSHALVPAFLHEIDDLSIAVPRRQKRLREEIHTPGKQDIYNF